MKSEICSNVPALKRALLKTSLNYADGMYGE